ncbi:MAG: tetratricopeptide repeat protein [Treponema sp.]|nr:tetratricopeptide repeat protein [Treponema sp.]
MAGDLSKRRMASDEKPVLNEKTQARYHEKASGRFESSSVEKKDKRKIARGLKDGIRLFRMKKWDNALKLFLGLDSAGFSREEQTELAYFRGLCCAKLERFDDAILYLEQVGAAGGDMLRAYQCRLTLAYIYVTTGRAKMAEFELKRLQHAGFESAPLYNTLAYASYIQNDTSAAIEYYEKSLDLDRENPTALNSMGYILADTGLDPLRGLRFCRRALEQKPQNPAYIDSLGWAYYKCGEMTEARSLLRRALELAPQEREIKEHFRIVTGGAV